MITSEDTPETEFIMKTLLFEVELYVSYVPRMALLDLSPAKVVGILDLMVNFVIKGILKK